MVRRSFVVRDVSEILIHWQAERPVTEIAHSLGIDPETVRKYVAVVTSLGYQPGQTNLPSQEWTAILHQYVPELVDSAKKSEVFAEIGRYHEAIVKGLVTNRPSTVWQRLHSQQDGLKASLRSFRRYLDLYLPDRPGKPELILLRRTRRPASR